MAGSKLYRIGTIFSRTTSLLETGVVSWKNRPLWYDVYKAFPPREDPFFGRKPETTEIRQIFYPEDKIRAVLYKRTKSLGVINLKHNTQKTLVQKFIKQYDIEQNQSSPDRDEQELYNATMSHFKDAKTIPKSEEPIPMETSIPKRMPLQHQPIKLKIGDLFKKKS